MREQDENILNENSLLMCLEMRNKEFDCKMETNFYDTLTVGKIAG